ncbi:hypothetical protein K466DRAFT_177964 [Polyporus arcularius HHB13444]|uniref:Uncharacterized protein n=1 Tax=Polyporus arcularius HHB13444 TaxID=1314778 RepID=A0A5C3PA05_9APHY|nr:hypothetical protein K466DRAFT_177964 [Polyporus arcularius HHB13444]
MAVSSEVCKPAADGVILRNPVDFMDFSFLSLGDDESEVADIKSRSSLDSSIPPTPASAVPSEYKTPLTSRPQTPSHTTDPASAATVFVTAPSSPTHADTHEAGPMILGQLVPMPTVVCSEAKQYYPLWSACDMWTSVWCSWTLIC